MINNFNMNSCIWKDLRLIPDKGFFYSPVNVKVQDFIIKRIT